NRLQAGSYSAMALARDRIGMYGARQESPALPAIPSGAVLAERLRRVTLDADVGRPEMLRQPGLALQAAEELQGRGQLAPHARQEGAAAPAAGEHQSVYARAQLIEKI